MLIIWPSRFTKFFLDLRKTKYYNPSGSYLQNAAFSLCNFSLPAPSSPVSHVSATPNDLQHHALISLSSSLWNVLPASALHYRPSLYLLTCHFCKICPSLAQSSLLYVLEYTFRMETPLLTFAPCDLEDIINACVLQTDDHVLDQCITTQELRFFSWFQDHRTCMYHRNLNKPSQRSEQNEFLF